MPHDYNNSDIQTNKQNYYVIESSQKNSADSWEQFASESLLLKIFLVLFLRLNEVKSVSAVLAVFPV